jgi:hypothetical protein
MQGTLLAPGTCAIPLRARESTMICAPLSTPWGHLHLTLAQRFGSTLVLHPGFDPVEALAALEQHTVNMAVLEPWMLAAILRLPRETLSWYSTPSLRVIAVRDKQISAELALPAIAAFGASLYCRRGPSIIRDPLPAHSRRAFATTARAA